MAWKDRKEVATSQRSIYTAPTEEAGLMAPGQENREGEKRFPTETALFKALSPAVAEAEKRWTMRNKKWPKIMAQLIIYFQDRREGHLF